MGTRKEQYTKKAIADSLIQLLRQKPVEKVTVSELCKLADINRSTFYAYYKDVYDLVEKSEDELYEVIHETTVKNYALSMNRGDKNTSLSLPALSAVQANKEMCKLLIERNNKQFLSRIIRSAHDFLDTEIRKTVQNQELLKFKNAYMLGGCAAILTTWLEEDCATPVALVDKTMLDLINSTQLIVNSK